jgi:deazaflavin-dependent oxidoreductase (nitroreductase family)
MPMPRLMARLNRAGVNRLLRRIAPRMPGLGVVVHRGRRSGRTYRTPVAVVPTSTGPVIGLFYGSQSDWVKNVLAAGELELLTTGRTLHFGSPRIYHDESRAGFGVVPRQILRLFRVSDFLALDSTSSSTAPGAQLSRAPLRRTPVRRRRPARLVRPIPPASRLTCQPKP